MRQQVGLSIAVQAGLLAVVGAAYAVGRSLGVGDCSKVTGLASVAGVVLSLIAVVRGSSVGRASGVALLVWLVVAAVTEQFAWVDDARGVAVGVAWLVPPAVGTLILLRRRECWVGAGCSVALFAGATSLVYSVTHTGSGVGLMFAWQS